MEVDLEGPTCGLIPIAPRRRMQHALAQEQTGSIAQKGSAMSLATNWPARIAYTIDEAVFASGISKRQIYRALERGELRAAWVAGRRRIAPVDLERYMRGEPMTGPPSSGVRVVSISGRVA